METSGAALSAEDLAGLLGEGTVHGLAELMNFPGTVQGDPEVLAKIATFSGGLGMATPLRSVDSSSTPTRPPEQAAIMNARLWRRPPKSWRADSMS